MSEERHARAIKLLKKTNFDTYDYTTASAADMSFPDFTESEAEEKGIWLAKCTNDTKAMSGLHLADLNTILDGETRRMMALYGAPYEWPSSTNRVDVINFIEPIEGARKEQSSNYTEILSQHGMLNEEHYLWCRNSRLGISEDWKSYEEAMEYVAEIEEKKEDKEQYLDLMNGHDIIDELHFEYIKALLKKSNDKRWEDINVILAETQSMLDDRFEKNKETLSDELSPYKNISMEMWAQANAQISQGTAVDAIIEQLGIEIPEWDDINNEWNERMSRDLTVTIATVYGQAFTGAAQGQFGSVDGNVSDALAEGYSAKAEGGDPISFEDWVKIQNHMNVAASQGIDANAVLGEYNLNAADWGTIGGYWSQKMNTEPQTYLGLFTTFTTKYTEMFVAKYASSDLDL